MADKPTSRDPLGEDQPIPGTPRSRIALVVGLAIALGLIAFFIWFFATHSDRSQGTGFFG